MTIRGAFVFPGLLAVLAGLWWGLRVDPASAPGPGERADSPPPRHEMPAVDSAEPDPSSDQCVILGSVTCRGEPVPASVQIRLIRPFEGKGPAARADRAMTRLGLVGREVRGPPLLTRTASADGWFTLPDLRPGRYEIRAVGANGRRGTERVDLRPPRSRMAVEIELPAGDLQLIGRVLWADGRPFAGSVWIGRNHGPELSRAVETDAEGRFRIPHLGPGKHPVTAGTGSTMVAYLDHVTVPAGEEVLLWIGKYARTVEGRVIDDATERPVANARLVFGKEWAKGTASSPTDDAGHFRILHPAGYEREWAVFADGYAPALIEGGFDRPDLTVRLVRDAALFGRVLEAATGEPVAGIPVLARGVTDRRSGATLVRATTDADGRYRIDGVAAGSVAVVACGNGRVSTGAAGRGTGIENRLIVTVPPGGEVDVDLVVVQTITISGRVHDAEGTGTAGVVVTAFLSWDGFPCFDEVADSSAVTASDGSFLVSGVIPHGSYWLHAWDGRDRFGELKDFRVPAAGVTGVVLELSSMDRVEATVTEAGTGRPVAGAMVSIAPSTRTHWSRGREGVTDGSGRAIVAGERGRMKVARATHPEYRPVPEWTPVGKDGTIALTLTRGEVVTGTVLLPSGEPARGGRVQWRETFGSGANRVRWYSETEIGANGEFRAAGLVGDDVEFEASHRNGDRSYSGEARIRAGTKGAVVRLTEHVRKEGKPPVRVLVLDPDGHPVPYGIVEGCRPDSWRRWRSERTLDELGNLRDGRAVLRRSREEIEWIEVHSTKDPAGRPLPWGSHRLTEIPEGADEIVIRLTRGQTISGRVVDDRGAGLRGVTVKAHSVREEGPTRHAADRTDAGGNFVLKGLGEPEYRLFATPVEGFASPDAVVASAGSDDVRLVLDPGPILRIRVINVPEEVEDLNVRLIRFREDEEPEDDWAELDRAGRCVFRGLHAKTGYTLWIGPTGDGRVFYREGVIASAEELVVRLTPGRTVSGRVILPPGVEPDDVYVNLWRRYSIPDVEGYGVYLDGSEIDERGRFEFRGLPPGAYRIDVGFTLNGRDYAEEKKVQAGGSVVLEPVPVPDEDE